MAAGISDFAISPSAAEIADFAGRAAVALALGAVIGVERQWRQRMAGLRTNALVSLGAALFVLFGDLLGGSTGADPTRIAAYVVSGVGFLGGGVILRDGVNVRGINTAATIWCSSAVGVLAGGGYIVEAVIAAVLVIIAHAFLRPVARRIDRIPATEESEVETVYTFRAVCRSADEAHIRALVVQALTRDEFVLRAVRSENLEHGDLVEVEAELQRFGRDDVALESAVSRLSLEPSVSSVSWNVIEQIGVVLAADE
ncbi:MAG: MgtC/SapB family protein [Acidimicrobiales bacterium]|nr:MgtC/SapB family protein [Acidimicrobiales bacterium]